MKPRKSYEPNVNLNLNVRGLAQSPTLAINERANAMIRGGKRIYKLGLGQSPFPVPRPVVETLKVNAHQKDYLPVKGLWPLREVIAEYCRSSRGMECTGEDVLIGPGSKELMFLIQLVYYGDLVIPTPSWVSYAPQAHIVGRPVHWVPARAENRWKLMADDLEELCKEDPDRPRILILNYPSNPTGMTYHVEDLKALAKVARKYRVIVLSDEIYSQLHFKGQHISIARFYPEGTIVSGGLSKWCGAGGWRLGCFIFPPSLRWLLDAMAVVASETFTATSAPIQYAAVRAFQGGIEIERYLWNCRRILKSLGRHVATALKKTGARQDMPEGGFYLFPDFGPFRESLARRGITTSHQLCEKLLLETGVACLPGIAFGHSAEELTARLAYVDFDGSQALAAAEQLSPDHEFDKEFLQRYCGNVMTATDLICDWIQAKG
jgi:aspartate aminotransferase